MGHHPNARIKASHPSHMSGMRSDEVLMVLFSPKAFQVSTSGESGICLGVHVGKVGDDKVGSKAESVQNKLRFRVQIGC